MMTRHSRTFYVVYGVVMIALGLVYWLIASPARADDDGHHDRVDHVHEPDVLNNTQAATSSGGANQLSIGDDRSVAVGLSHGAPSSPACPTGLVPGRGRHRGHGSPLYSVSAVCDAPDESQAAAIQAAREHELALVRLAAELASAEAARERAVAERIRAEVCFECAVSK